MLKNLVGSRRSPGCRSRCSAETRRPRSQTRGHRQVRERVQRRRKLQIQVNFTFIPAGII